MKKIIFLLLLCQSHISVGANQPEWQFYVPSEAADISGVYIDYNEALVISQIGGLTPLISSLVFNDEFPLDIGDNIGITGFAMKPSGISDISYSMSLSSSTDIFESDDVIECLNGVCSSFLDLSEDLSAPQNIKISAISWSGVELHISTTSGFFNNSNYIDPCRTYIYNGVSQPLTAQFNVNDHFNCSVNSFSESFNNVASYYSLDIIYEPAFSNTTYFPSEVRGLTNSPPAAVYQNIYTQELLDEVSDIIAYQAIDTGWIEFSNNSLQVNENAGILSFTVKRVEGSEFYISSFADTSSGTAINGTDYSFIEVIPKWNHLETVDKTYNITIIDNNITDGNKVFTINLSTPSELALINPLKNQITVTIIDDETSDLIFNNGFEGL
jgi:hypothetical protein